MMDLLVDIGNSRLKYVSRPPDRQTPGALVIDDDIENRLRSAWQRLAAPQRIIVASVGAHETFLCLASVARELGWPEPVAVGVRRQWRGLTVGYEDINQLGVDRWLAMLGAVGLGVQPCIVVDAGTALTLDAVDAQGRHRGGGIVPGLTAMRATLPTDMPSGPPTDETREVPFPATNTADGIRSATLLGLADLVAGLVARLATGETASATVVLTGGDASALQPHLAMPVSHQPDLVLAGLRRATEQPHAP